MKAVGGALSATLIAVLLAGCVLPQREAPRGAPIDAQALGLGAGAPLAPVAADWWKSFDDPQFDALMEEALQRSPTLGQALARMRLAQAVQADITASRPGIAIEAGGSAFRAFTSRRLSRAMWIGQATANLRWGLDFGAAGLADRAARWRARE